MVSYTADPFEHLQISDCSIRVSQVNIIKVRTCSWHVIILVHNTCSQVSVCEIKKSTSFQLLLVFSYFKKFDGFNFDL